MENQSKAPAVPQGTDSQRTTTESARLAGQAARLARRVAKKHLRRKKKSDAPPLHLLVNGLVQALIWATDEYLGPALRTAAAAAFHGHPSTPKLTPWTEPKVRHASVQSDSIYDRIVQDSSAQTQKTHTVFKECQTDLSNYEYRCAVCLDITGTCVTQCGHSLCVTCGEKIVQNRHKCPICRQPISAFAPHPGLNENTALPDPDKIDIGHGRTLSDLVNEAETRDEPLTPHQSLLPELRGASVSERLDFMLADFQQENPHLQVYAMLDAESGENYFDSESRQILDNMYLQNYDTTAVHWRINLDNSGALGMCTICHRRFNSMKIFDLHNLVFHFRETPWPSWVKIFVNNEFNVDYPETKYCMLCGLLVDDDRCLSHFEEAHCCTS